MKCSEPATKAGFFLDFMTNFGIIISARKNNLICFYFHAYTCSAFLFMVKVWTYDLYV